MRKCLGAAYIAENQVLRGLTETSMKIVLHGNLVSHSATFHC